MQVHRDIMDGRYRAAPFAAGGQPRPGSRREARDRGRRHRRRALLHRRRAPSSRPAPASAPTASSAASATSRSTRSSSASIVWANTRISQEAVVRGSILGRHCHIGRSAAGRERRRARRQVGDHRLQPAIETMGISIDPTIFKAYDIRGIYPAGGQRGGRARHRRGVRRVPEGQADRRRPRHAAVVARRWPRRSSTAPRRRAPTSSTTG